MVGIYGLGIMGGTMAKALLDHGYKVCGFDVDAKAKNRFKKYGGQFLAHASDVAARADILIVSVATSKALEQVTQAIVDGQHNRKVKTPPIVIETSTLTMADKNLCAKALKRVDISALDCPSAALQFACKTGLGLFLQAAAKLLTKVSCLFWKSSPTTCRM